MRSVRAARRWKRRIATVAALVLFGADAGAQRPVQASLADLSLEELSNIEVTSVSRRAERLSDAATAIFVITADDIRRSGATSLPEALRLAPNLYVARGTTPGYAITARGFASNGNKMLVLIDGRSVYTPLFSGVFWDVQNVMLEDVERIEVISGPGSTLWGVNAVNGVINIITRSARDTQGGLASLGAGNQETEGALRHGGAFDADGAWRVYAKHLDRDASRTLAGTAKDDALRLSQLGLRADWGGARDRFSAQGDAYRGTEGQPLPGTIVTGAVFPLGGISLSGANLLGRWQRALDGAAELTVLAYYDRTERVVQPQFSETLDIVDVQVQYAAPPLAGHAVFVGAEYRASRDRVVNSDFVAFLPARLSQRWFSAFVQDDVALLDSLRLSAGARVERNDYTGNEFLPSLRLAWKVTADHLLWASASRTVRAPSRLDRDTFVPGTQPYLLIGGPDVRSEIAKVYELGYRGRPASRVSFSLTLFHADYDHLRTQEVRLNPTVVFFANGMEGETYGGETWGTLEVTRGWRLHAGYTRLERRLRLKPGSIDTPSLASVGSDPEHRWIVRSSHDLPGAVELDAMVRHASALSSPQVPGYVAVDARLAWGPRADLELSVAGQNLFDRGHGEFAAAATRSEFGRTVFFRVRGRF